MRKFSQFFPKNMIVFIFILLSLLFSCSRPGIPGVYQPLDAKKNPIENTSIRVSEAGKGYLFQQRVHDTVVYESFSLKDDDGKYRFKSYIGLKEISVVVWPVSGRNLKGYTLLPLSDNKNYFYWKRIKNADL